MKLLWILPKYPYPAIDGATKAHLGLLSNMANNRVTLSIALFSEEKTMEEIKTLKTITGAKDIFFLSPLTFSRPLLFFKSLFFNRKLPATAARFATYKAKISLPDLGSYTHLVFDGLHPAALFWESDRFHFPSHLKIIYRAHNIEAELWKQVVLKQKHLFKLIYEREQKKMLNFESKLIARSDLVATVSLRDKNLCSKLYSVKKCESIEIGMPWNNVLTDFTEGMKLLFIGRLDWYPNVEGLNWFLDKVWPVVCHKRPEVTLDIVGGFAPEALVKKLKSQKNCRYHGQVPDVSKFYEQCTITIIPIWTGSGTRVKAIEAAKFARSFISSSKGIEGVELTANRDYLLADDEQSWVKILLSLAPQEAKQLGVSAQENARVKYDQDLLQKHFLELLEGL